MSDSSLQFVRLEFPYQELEISSLYNIETHTPSYQGKVLTTGRYK